jgi:YVTN family beta-propeller protein
MFRPFRVCLCGALATAFVSTSVITQAAGVRLSQPDAIGRIATNRYALPNGQLLSPAGAQIELPSMRPQVFAMSPDRKVLVTAGKTNGIAVIDVASGKVIQMATLSTNAAEAKAAADKEKKEKDDLDAGVITAPDAAPTTNTTDTSVSSTTDGTARDGASTNRSSGRSGRGSGSRTNSSGSSAAMSFNGLTFSPDGKWILLANAQGDIRVFPVGKDHRVGTPTRISIPRVSSSRREIPTGIAISEDSQRAYVVGNVGSKLHEIDIATGAVLRSWNTGVAPFEVILLNGKAYVSNVGGRIPGTNDVKALAGRRTYVRVDSTQYLPTEGSVTVIDLATGEVKGEIMVELHASAMALSPNKKYLVVANTGSDTLSVIDTRTDRVVEKIWARQTPADLFGAQPNALCFDKRGKKLFVANGTQNAVAVIEFEPEDNASKVVGLIPVGWFPGALEFEDGKLFVANIKGIGANKVFKPQEPTKLATKDFFGTVSIIPMPSDKQLAAMTQISLANLRYVNVKDALLPPRPNVPARPVPERTGEPSLFKHVIYIIKENRTYDQVLGDMKEGNGATNLCVFGERYTPNQHKIAREFVLLDNTYCAGVQSADGHQWTDSGIANEYVERQLTAAWPRSYPGGKAEDGIDALAWSASGFIWDNALKHGKTFRNYGEWMITEAGWTERGAHGRTNVAWKDFYADYVNDTKQTRLKSKPAIESLRKHSKLDTVGWDLHVPDVMRAAKFIEELKQFELNGGFPDLSLVFLPNDHTGGTKGRYPIPGAQVADNDLAFGQLVEAVSHSKFWPETCIIAIEDDPQAGWDHVSGYRTTCYVVSPYTKRRQTVSTQYNQLSVLRTIEVILGLPPMNQLDAAATPMFDCFQDVAVLTPFTSVSNRIALDQINPEPKKVANKILRRDAEMSARLNLDEQDKADEDTFNRLLWRAMKGPDVPYPEWAVKALEDDDD